MDRMAQHTKQPEVLHELFEALGNDSFVIAECLARPALADRLLTNWYAYDQKIHGELKQRAEADLKAHNAITQMKQTSGKYSEIELVKGDSSLGQDSGGGGHGVKLNSREWDETVQRLATIISDRTVAAGVSPANLRAVAAGVPATPKPSARVSPANGAPITEIKTGVLSSLQEDETRYYAASVIEKTENRLKLATVAWRKEPLESWLARAENEMPRLTVAVTTGYTLPTTEAGGCIDDTWMPTFAGLAGRHAHVAVWTGSEMIVWGGWIGGDTATGGRYNPSTDAWVNTSMVNVPQGREFATAVWTGTEMIIWGGDYFDGSNYVPLNTGGTYNPSTDSWTPTSVQNAPNARIVHTSVWTGGEMIVWGGCDENNNCFNTGGRYNPNMDTWTPTSTANAPSQRGYHTAVWSGSEMIVWGGRRQRRRFQYRRQVQSKHGHLDSHEHYQRALCARVARSGVDWQRNDCLGWNPWWHQLFEHWRKI
jgi:hypothetical protein